MTRLIGIDPGLNRTGWGVLESKGTQLSFLAAGTLTTDAKAPLEARLKSLHDELLRLVETYRPQEAAVEETFVNSNSLSSLKLGQARGALLLTLSLGNLAVSEYAATAVKKAVTGNGRAEKEQVARMVQVLLPAVKSLGTDATDALAVAICHAHHRQSAQAKLATLA